MESRRELGVEILLLNVWDYKLRAAVVNVNVVVAADDDSLDVVVRLDSC